MRSLLPICGPHDFPLLDSLRDTCAANVARELDVDALHTALHDG